MAGYKKKTGMYNGRLVICTYGVVLTLWGQGCAAGTSLIRGSSLKGHLAHSYERGTPILTAAVWDLGYAAGTGRAKGAVAGTEKEPRSQKSERPKEGKN